MAATSTRRRRRRQARQSTFLFPNTHGHYHGGRREGAGRPKLRDRRRRVSHAARELLPSSCPVHVTVRLRKGLPSLRNLRIEKALRDAFCAMKMRPGFKIVHYSIQSNHLHLILEAQGRDALSRGMQSLSIRIAKTLNKLWQRKGTIFEDRYHAQILRSARQVRHAIVYVLTNAWKHGAKIREALDRFASGWCFDGYKENVIIKNGEDLEPPVQHPGTHLLAKAWRRLGKISVHERAKSQPD